MRQVGGWGSSSLSLSKSSAVSEWPGRWSRVGE